MIVNTLHLPNKLQIYIQTKMYFICQLGLHSELSNQVKDDAYMTNGLHFLVAKLDHLFTLTYKDEQVEKLLNQNHKNLVIFVYI